MVLPPTPHTCPARLGTNGLACSFDAGHNAGPGRTGHVFVASSQPQEHDTEASGE